MAAEYAYAIDHFSDVGNASAEQNDFSYLLVHAYMHN